MNIEAIAEMHSGREYRKRGATEIMSTITKEHKGAITGSLVSILLGALAWGFEAGKTREKFDALIARVQVIESNAQTGTPYSRETRWALDQQTSKLNAVEIKTDHTSEQMQSVIGDVREIKGAVARIEKSLEKLNQK